MTDKLNKTEADIKAAVAKGEYPLDFKGWHFESDVDLNGVVFAGDVDFSDSVFKGEVNFSIEAKANSSATIFKAKANFYSAIFEAKANFSSAVFNGEVNFSGAVFKGEVNFSIELKDYSSATISKANATIFKAKANFYQATFEAKADFSAAIFAARANFSEVIFKSEAYFSGITIKKGDLTFNFNNTVFSGIAKFTHQKNPTKIKDFSTEHTIFEAPVLIDLPFENCPDFSKCRFLKTVIIEETWTTKNIENEFEAVKTGAAYKFEKMENKFRFFKTYFAGVGNHFKEIEYFKYEMHAKQARLKNATLAPTSPEPLKSNWFKHFLSKVITWFRHLPSKFIAWFKCLSSAEYLLFALYKWSSDYGTSPARSFYRLFGFFLIVVGVSCLVCDETVGVVFADNLKRTLLPFNSLKDLSYCGWARNLFLTFQVFLNTILIFLIALGLRSKFRIK